MSPAEWTEDVDDPNFQVACRSKFRSVVLQAVLDLIDLIVANNFAKARNRRPQPAHAHTHVVDRRRISRAHGGRISENLMQAGSGDRFECIVHRPEWREDHRLGFFYLVSGIPQRIAAWRFSFA